MFRAKDRRPPVVEKPLAPPTEPLLPMLYLRSGRPNPSVSVKLDRPQYAGNRPANSFEGRAGLHRAPDVFVYSAEALSGQYRFGRVR